MSPTFLKSDYNGFCEPDGIRCQRGITPCHMGFELLFECSQLVQGQGGMVPANRRLRGT